MLFLPDNLELEDLTDVLDFILVPEILETDLLL
jgi:hypothetical protein